jgi:hypothetical protein
VTGDTPTDASPALLAYLDLDARLSELRTAHDDAGQALLDEMEAMWSGALSREERDWLEYRSLRVSAGKRGENVPRKLVQLWPEAAPRERARLALAGYGSATHESEVERVHLAVLKLCAGRLERVGELVDEAKRERAGLLFRAEHPREAAADWARAQSLSPSDELRLADLRTEDAREYWEWLRG